MNSNFENGQYNGRDVYLYSDPTTFTDEILRGLNSSFEKKYLGFDSFENIGNNSLTIIVNRNVESFKQLQKNQDYLDQYLKTQENAAKTIIYGSLYLAEEDTITESTWFSSSSLAIIFVVIIMGLMIWFMMHYMLAVQSIGPAEFKRPKTD